MSSNASPSRRRGPGRLAACRNAAGTSLVADIAPKGSIRRRPGPPGRPPAASRAPRSRTPAPPARARRPAPIVRTADDAPRAGVRPARIPAPNVHTADDARCRDRRRPPLHDGAGHTCARCRRRRRLAHRATACAAVAPLGSVDGQGRSPPGSPRARRRRRPVDARRGPARPPRPGRPAAAPRRPPADPGPPPPGLSSPATNQSEGSVTEQTPQRPRRRPRPRRTTGAWPSSAWATWGCRWPSRSPRRASRCRAWTPSRAASMSSTPATPRSTTSPTSAWPRRSPPTSAWSARTEADLAAADAIFVCVPTPITTTKDPDLAPVLAAARTIKQGLRAGQLIILQSTTFPGTTTGPFREVLEETGLRAGDGLRPGLRPGAGQPGRPGQRQQGRAAPGRRDHARRPRSARPPCSGTSTTRS